MTDGSFNQVLSQPVYVYGVSPIGLPSVLLSGGTGTLLTPSTVSAVDSNSSVSRSPLSAGFYNVSGQSGIVSSKGNGHYCTYGDTASFLAAGGANDQSNVTIILPAPLQAMQNDGPCIVPTIAPGFFQISGQTAINISNGQSHYCTLQDPQSFLSAGGSADDSNVQKFNAITTGMQNDGPCIIKIPAGYFSFKGTIYNANSSGHFCGFAEIQSFLEAGGKADQSNVKPVMDINYGMIYDGVCVVPMAGGFFKIANQATVYNSNGTCHYCHFPDVPSYIADGGASDESNVRFVNDIDYGMQDDGVCAAPIQAGFFKIGTAVYNSNGQGHYCAFVDPQSFLDAGGTSDESSAQTLTMITPGNVNDGTCVVPVPAGMFRLGGTVYNSNGAGHICWFANPQDYLAAGGPADIMSGVRSVTDINFGAIDDGNCVH